MPSFLFFFFSRRRRHTRWPRDWSSDVCSSDLDARDAAMADWLEERGARWTVCAGYMQLLRAPFLDRFAGRIINTHSAPLPEFPGAHPIEDVLAAGVRETAATVHFVDEGIDTGAVITSERVPVYPNDTPDVLRERVK